MTATKPKLTQEQLVLALNWPGISNVRGCTVKIGRSTYHGFTYQVPEGWGSSDGTPQPSWGEWRFYLLSDTLPPSVRRSTVYRIEGDDADWFMAGYVTPETAASEQYGYAHPLGAHFLLVRWNHERLGGRIDADEIGRYGRVHPYPRMTIEVNYD